ncbi:MAG: DUF1638 domain-containing protein, partial [Euryarchaeota archaeon]|nr:DUF1638 domain-containing protein [Euryarchaeota archaeon]
REQYRELVTKNLGVYFMTPMWAKHWREMAVKTRVVPDGNNNELMKMVFDASGYKKMIKIETEAGDGDYEKRVDEFAGIFGVAKETLKCDLRVIDITYGKAKECLGCQ